MNEAKKTNSVFKIFAVLFLILIILAGVYFVYAYIVKARNQPLSQSQSGNVGIPQAKEIDTAPQLPANQKTEITIMQTDSTYVKYLVPSANVNQFIHTLPSGDQVEAESAAN